MTRASRRSTVVEASSSACRRGSSIWTIPDEQVGQDRRVVGDHQVAAALRLGRRRDGLDLERTGCVIDELVQVDVDLEIIGTRVVIVLVVVVGARALDLDPDVEGLDGLARRVLACSSR